MGTGSHRAPKGQCSGPTKVRAVTGEEFTAQWKAGGNLAVGEKQASEKVREEETGPKMKPLPGHRMV